MKKTSQKIEPGKRARLNAAYYKLFGEESPAKPRECVVLGQHEPIAGCWRVRLDGVPPVQFVNEAFLEVLS